VAVKDLRDSDKVTTKTANPKTSRDSDENAANKKNMPCKNSLPT
jgi:hypothetical protein